MEKGCKAKPTRLFEDVWPAYRCILDRSQPGDRIGVAQADQGTLPGTSGRNSPLTFPRSCVIVTVHEPPAR